VCIDPAAHPHYPALRLCCALLFFPSMAKAALVAELLGMLPPLVEPMRFSVSTKITDEALVHGDSLCIGVKGFVDEPHRPHRPRVGALAGPLHEFCDGTCTLSL
jgi:hypothetical protein